MKLKTLLMFSGLVFLCSCSSMLYQPTRYLYYAPKNVGAQERDVWFTNSKGNKLHGWYFDSVAKTPSRGLIVFFHGNAQNLSAHYLTLVWVLAKGYDFFIFDYSGYGRSEGEPSPEMTIHDGVAALQKARELAKVKSLPLFVFGQSLGGAIAITSVAETKKTVPVRALFVDSSFYSYQAAGRYVLSNFWLTWPVQPLAYVFLSDRYAPKNRIGDISPIPLIVMHGDADQVLGISLSEEIYKRAKEPKEFWKVPGGKHTDSFWVKDDTYRNRFIAKLESLEAK